MKFHPSSREAWGGAPWSFLHISQKYFSLKLLAIT